MQYTGVGEAFMNGQVAMNSGSAYDLKNFEKNAPDLAANLGIAPAFSSTGQYEMSVQNLSISAKSKNIPTARRSPSSSRARRSRWLSRRS